MNIFVVVTLNSYLLTFNFFVNYYNFIPTKFEKKYSSSKYILIIADNEYSLCPKISVSTLY